MNTAAASISGNWATLLLPLNRDESIDYALLAEEVERFAAARVDGIYSNGSAGEFYTQTEAEFDRVQEILARGCAARGVPFQIGAAHSSPQIALERIRRAKALQPRAFQIVLPDWFPPTFDEIVAFIDRIAAAADPIPLIVYNPAHAKRRLDPGEWRALIDRHPAIVGMKVPGGDEAWYLAMQPVLERVSVFIPGHTLATGIARGAHGAYSNVACLSPRGAQAWSDECRTNLPAALEREKRIQAFWSAWIAPLITRDRMPNMAADKAAAVAGGWLPGLSPALRWPYRAADDATVRAIAAAARSQLPEFF